MVNIQLSARTLILLALVPVALWALFNLWEIVVIVATSFILMAAALPYVDWLVRRGIKRPIAVLVLLFAVMVVLAGLLALVVPALIEEGKDVHSSLPEYGRKLDEQLAKYDIESDLEQRAADIEWGNALSGSAAVDFGQRVIIAFLSLVTIVVITAYLLIDAPRLSGFVYQFVRPGREPEVQRFLDGLRLVVGGYVRGQVITSAVIASFTAGVMFVLGLPNALAFGVLAAFADILPLVGATLAIAPAVLIALDESVTKAAIVLVALMAYQQFEDRYLTPRVYGSTLNLPPIIVLVAALVGGKVFGITGVLLALPAAAVARVILDEFLQRRSLVMTGGTAQEDAFAPDAEVGANNSRREA